MKIASKLWAWKRTKPNAITIVLTDPPPSPKDHRWRRFNYCYRSNTPTCKWRLGYTLWLETVLRSSRGAKYARREISCRIAKELHSLYENIERFYWYLTFVIIMIGNILPTKDTYVGDLLRKPWTRPDLQFDVFDAEQTKGILTLKPGRYVGVIFFHLLLTQKHRKEILLQLLWAWCCQKHWQLLQKMWKVKKPLM